MQLEFTKMHGAGNDVIVFEAPGDGRLPTAARWRELSDRHKGIGFDQAMVLEPARRAGTDIYYRIFNADGGEVEQCGNGVRCGAWWRTGARQPGRAHPGTGSWQQPRVGRHGNAELRSEIAAFRSLGRS